MSKRKFLLFFIMSYVANTVSADDLYDQSLSFLKQFIAPHALVFDVGANVGKKTELYLACGAQVICFEPQPECLKVLDLKFNKNKNVIIQACGLGSADGSIDLFVCSDANTISSCSPEWTQNGRFVDQGYKWDRKIVVQITTLDQMIKKYGMPMFCKIDVENFEYQVLKGLTQQIPYVSFEFAGEYLANTRKCIEHLISLGSTQFNFALAEDPELIFPHWLSAQQMIVALEKMVMKDPLVWGDVYAKSL